MGKAMRAVAHDRRVASLMGINVTAVMVGAFFLSSALAGLSGFLIAPIASASLYVGLAIALKGFSGAIIGGLSNPRGCVLGGFALGVLESLVNLWQAQWREIVVFLLVILVLGVPAPRASRACARWRKYDARSCTPSSSSRSRRRRLAPAAVIGNDYYLRIALHDVRLLPVRGRHERAGRLRGAEVARAGRPVRRRRLRGARY